MKKPPNQALRRRRGVEIYFVLYLTALLLLMLDKRGTDTKPDEELVIGLLQTNFSIQAEKNLLNCTALRTEDGLQIISLDSVNTIFSKGNVTDVQYDFTIIDVARNRNYVINENQQPDGQVGYGYRRLDEGERAVFNWKPDLSSGDRAVYTIRVEASAKPLVPARITSPEQRRQLEKIIEEGDQRVDADTRFQLAVTFVGDANIAANLENDNPVDTVTRVIYQQGDQPVTVINAPAGNITFSPANAAVYAVANARWHNRIVVGGIDLKNDLAESPEISVDGEGEAAIASIDDGAIRVDGTAPTKGQMRVTLRLRRRSDDQTAGVSFDVRTRPLPAALTPARMYPGLSYNFDPRFPALVGQDVKAVLRDAAGRERHVSVQGEAFSFTPQRSDIGADFELIRSVNGKTIATSSLIPVRDFPLPEIAEVNKQSGKAIVRTRAYGGPQSSNRISIKIDGNAQVVSERHGEWEYLPEGNMHIQVFEVEPRDRNKAFEFSVKAVDRNGRESEKRDVGG